MVQGSQAPRQSAAFEAAETAGAVAVPSPLATRSQRVSGSPRVQAGPVGFHGLCEFVLMEKMPQICSGNKESLA